MKTLIKRLNDLKDEVFICIFKRSDIDPEVLGKIANTSELFHKFKSNGYRTDEAAETCLSKYILEMVKRMKKSNDVNFQLFKQNFLELSSAAADREWEKRFDAIFGSGNT